MAVEQVRSQGCLLADLTIQKILTNYSFIHLFALSRQADPFQHKSWFEWVAYIDNNKAKAQH